MGETAPAPSPVLVTGANGFVGRRVVARLSGAGLEVRALVRSGASDCASSLVVSVRADLFDPEALRKAAEGCRSVVHLAAKTHEVSGTAPLESYRRTNVEGTRALLDASVKAGAAAFCFVSSVKAIGEGGEATLDESVPEKPETPYGITKLEAERLVASAAGAAGMRWTVLRLPLVYGAGVKGNLARMLEAVAGGFFPPPPRVANRRSLVAAEDVARACELVLRDPRSAGRTYVLTDGRDYSTREIYELVASALGKTPSRFALPVSAFRAAARTGDALTALGVRPPFDSDRLEKLVGSASYSSRRIRLELGFSPSISLPEALPAMVASHRAGKLRQGA
jgi:UDP-glucose 4-epimerase